MVGNRRGRATTAHHTVVLLVWLGVVLPAWHGRPVAVAAQDHRPLPLKLVVTERWRVHGATLHDGLTSVTGLAEATTGAIWVSDMSLGHGRVLAFDPSNAAVVALVKGPARCRGRAAWRLLLTGAWRCMTWVEPVSRYMLQRVSPCVASGFLSGCRGPRASMFYLPADSSSAVRLPASTLRFTNSAGKVGCSEAGEIKRRPTTGELG